MLDGPPLDTRLLRQAMGRFATGVTVLTTRGTCGKREGLTVNSFSTVSLDPPLVLWSLSRGAGSFATFAAAPFFVVNVLASDQLDLCRHFSTRQDDKLAGIAYRDGLGGCPVLEPALAQFECRREMHVDGGDHTIFIGRVLRVAQAEGEPLIFAGGSYHRPMALPPAGD